AGPLFAVDVEPALSSRLRDGRPDRGGIFGQVHHTVAGAQPVNGERDRRGTKFLGSLKQPTHVFAADEVRGAESDGVNLLLQRGRDPRKRSMRLATEPAQRTPGIRHRLLGIGRDPTVYLRTPGNN